MIMSDQTIKLGNLERLLITHVQLQYTVQTTRIAESVTNHWTGLLDWHVFGFYIF